MTVTLAQWIAKVDANAADDLGLAMREAVNKSAQVVTAAARKAVQGAIGSEQRLSGSRIKFSWTVEQPGTDSRRVITEANPAGRRINPAYKPAHSTERPVALVGVRGPAQWIEHSRRGGYDIRPRRRTLTRPLTAKTNEFVERMLGGKSTRLATAERGHAPALPAGGGRYRAKVEGGAIHRTSGPIGRTFALAPRLIRGAAEQAVRDRLKRQGY